MLRLARLLVLSALSLTLVTPALAQKDSAREGGETRESPPAVGWYQVTMQGGVEMVQASEIEVLTVPGMESSLFSIDGGKPVEIDLFTDVSFHGFAEQPGPEMASESSSTSSSSETVENSDGSTTKTKSTSTSKTNRDGSTTTTTQRRETTTHPDGSTEEVDVVIVRTTPPTIR